MTEKSHEPCEGKAASHSRGKPEERARAGAEEWLAPLFSDSSLWPLVLVVGGCLSTLGAAILVAALYHQNFFAAAALLGLCWICFDVSKRHRRAIGRTGLLGWSIVSLWALSLVIGGLAIGLGIV